MKKLFDEIPYLEGERVILRKITEDDRETLQEMAHSPTPSLVANFCLERGSHTCLHGEFS